MSKEKPQTKVCKHCKTEIPYDAKVCSQCGKKQGGKAKWVLIVILVLGIIGSAFGDEDSQNVSDEENKQAETVADDGNSKETESREETNNELDKHEKYEPIFICDLLENWSKYAGDYVTVSFKASYAYDYTDRSTIESKLFDETNSKLRVESEGVANVSEGEWITVSGIVGEKEYDGLGNATIGATGKESKKTYETGKEKYDKKKKEEAEKREKKFRESAKEVSYDELLRYPDTYEKKKIKVVVKITEVEPDGIIFPGDIQGTLEGKEIAVYDERDVKEPKLVKGDTITIYGKGNGLTTVKVKQKSGIFSKTVDEYSIPGIKIKYMDLQ